MILTRTVLILTLIAFGSLVGCDSSTPEVGTKLPDFSEYTDVKEKKKAFFGFILPLVHEANARILAERALAEKWQQGETLSSSEQKQLKEILTKYRVTVEDVNQQQEQLLQKVNILPPSLVLAQAANESAWGNSRFARKGNNLFGQWCFTKGCGIVPGSRNSGAVHEVEVFSTPYGSVSSYMRNLNSHQQYRQLRQLRGQALQNDKPITGVMLAEGLTGYSERGEEYVHEIQSMIRFNKLEQLDANPLGEKEN